MSTTLTSMAAIDVAWTTTRAAGLVALAASTASIVLGLALAGRLAKGRGKLGDARVLHQTFGIATVVALAVHVISLLFDPWLSPALSDVAVPFTMEYRPVWTGLGIIAGYGIVVLGLSGFLRARLGARWKYVHRLTGVAWAMSIAHTIGAGSDVGTVWLWATLVACVGPVVVLLSMRIARARRGTATASPRRPSPEARAEALMRAAP